MEFKYSENTGPLRLSLQFEQIENKFTKWRLRDPRQTEDNMERWGLWSYKYADRALSLLSVENLTKLEAWIEL